MFTSLSAHRIRNFKKDKSVYLFIYPPSSDPPHKPFPALHFLSYLHFSGALMRSSSLVWKRNRIRSSSLLRRSSSQVSQSRVWSTRVSSRKQRKATVIFFLNILSRRRSGERRLWLSNCTSPLWFHWDGRCWGGGWEIQGSVWQRC